MNSSDHMRKAIAGYFNDPRGSSARTGTDRSGAGEAVPLSRNDLRDLKQRLEQEIASKPALVKLKQQIQITITPEGLRIELIESRDGTFFDSGSATLNQNGRDLLTLLAHQLGDVPNNVSVEGHTDARAYADADGYGNWELSADRANAARRLMERKGLRTGQISQVRGFADRQLRVPGDPLDPSNRRISVIVHYLTQKRVTEESESAARDTGREHHEVGAGPSKTNADAGASKSPAIADRSAATPSSPASKSPSTSETPAGSTRMAAMFSRVGLDRFSSRAAHVHR
jgi:chemotaxis protein MotB